MLDVDELGRDIRDAARGLRRSPVFATVAILTLSLGIGANTAVFSVVNAIIFRPLPVRDANRLAVIANSRSATSRLGPVSFPDLQDYRTATRDVFEDIAGYSVGFIGFAPRGARPDRVLFTTVTGNYFSLLGIQPAHGRLIRPDEGLPGRTDPILVLGYSAWRRRFGGDPSVIGRTAMLNGRPCTIVGVAPAEFVGTFAFSESEVYLPINWSGAVGPDDRSARSLHAIARLRPEVTIGRAQAAMDIVAARLEREYPETNRAVRTRVLPERLARPEEDNARSNGFGAAIMLALVALVLLVADVNITNLLLARAATRRKELAIRTALGASRCLLLRQLVAEIAMLAVLGGIAGVGLGTWTGRLLSTIRLPGDLPGSRLDFHLDYRVLAYSVTLTTATALFVGLVAARRALRTDVDEALHDYGQRSMSLTGSHRIRKTLVVVQIAVCFVLLVAAGLFMHSLSRAAHADFGFRPEGVLNVQMDVAQVGYPESRGRSFFAELQSRVARIAGVEDVAFAVTVAMGYVRLSGRLEAEGRPTPSAEQLVAGKNNVGPRYFATMGIAIEEGRSFTDADDGQSRPVAIVNRRLAKVLWPGQSAVGRRFSQGGANSPWLEVVGVTATGKYRFLFEDPQPYFYVPLAQEYSGLRVLHVRTTLSPEALAPMIAREVHALEPELPLYDVQSMTKALNSGYGLFAVRTGAFFAAALALLGVALAVVGLYGMVSYTTSERTHEIGVRVALGASSRNIAAMVIREGATLAVAGTAVGLAAAWALARILSSLLFGVTPGDPTSFAVAAACVLIVTLAATWRPARRAARVDPVVTLRTE